MWRSPKPRFDVASAICQGGRDYQEDAIVTDFPFGTDTGVAVLADGMGGHAAGDVASKLVVTEVFSELKFQSANFVQKEAYIPNFMTAAAAGANASVKDYVKSNPMTHGMGATLVSLVLVENRMFWMSIGDSPLYHLRAGKMQQLNEDHSMAPQIDFMAAQGLIDPELAKDHPDRNCLTSVILGEKVAKTDCPTEPFELKVGDIVVVSSDGLQYLEDDKIKRILHKYRRRTSAEIAGYLLEAIEALADPDQDNVSLAVIKLNHNNPMERTIAPKPVDVVDADVAKATRVVQLADVKQQSDTQEPFQKVDKPQVAKDTPKAGKEPKKATVTELPFKEDKPSAHTKQPVESPDVLVQPKPQSGKAEPPLQMPRSPDVTAAVKKVPVLTHENDNAALKVMAGEK